MSKNISHYVNQVVNHKKFGEVLVKEVISAEQEKFIGEILADSILKKFIFSSNFFDISDSIAEAEYKVLKSHIPQRKKPRDYSKYRSHPLVKSIDAKENKLRKQLLAMQDDDDDVDDIEEDDNE